MRLKGACHLIRANTYSLFFTVLLISCDSSKRINTDYLYFRNGADTVFAQQKETLIQPYDLLSIQVYSRTLNQEQAAIFNIPTTTNNSAQGYEVNTAGNIEMPVIGPVKAAGLTIDQLQTALVQNLTNNVKNPSVIVRFLQFNVDVLGEVRIPGTKKFNVDRVTIIDALSAAGDLTDFGRREDVKVIREEGGKKIYHTVDLRSKTIFESPVYVLQPNDIVYVSPNKYKLKNLNVDPETQRRTSLFFTIFSAILGATSLIVLILRT
jgi:polysaccharide biosynthesis/export protein